MTLALFILIFACVTNLSLGLFVLLRNQKFYSSRAFFMVALQISAWSVANYLTELESAPLRVNMVFNRLAFLFALLGVGAITVFCFNFPQRIPVGKLRRNIFLAVLSIMSVLCLTPLVAGEVSKDQSGLHFTLGSLASLYVVVLLGVLGVGVFRLLKTRRLSNKKVRSQLNLMILGFIATVVLGVTTNVIVPLIVRNFETAKFGPLLSVFLVGSITYAIVRYGLFDIRLVVARSAAYVLSTATLALIYTLIVFGLARFFLHGTVGGLFTGQQVINIIAALLIAFSFRGLISFFNKQTNRFFYRDAYDPQAFINELNQVLVSTIDLDKLLHQCAEVIELNIKASFCTFVIRATPHVPGRTMGSGEGRPKEENLAALRSIIHTVTNKITVTDALGEDQADLQKALEENEGAILIRLTTTLSHDAEDVGIIVLGRKKSGNPYTSQDTRMLEIVANELVIAIQNALRFEEIQNFNVTLQEQIERATHKLQKTNEKLKALDETKDDFISMASHQLRTPLTSVKGYLSMVIEGDVGKITAKQEKLLNQAFVSSQRMVYLIADLLNVSRLRTGKFVIETTPTNLADVIEGEVSQLVEVASGRDLTLTYHKPEGFPTLMLDETKIRQVLMNFIDNAIYYTPAGGHIEVKLEETAESITLKVIDDGIGVPKAEQHHLFTKFYRANNAKKARPDGTGLGLFMAKKVIIAQGGSIIFKSQEGKGSTFGFTFAKAKLRQTVRSGDSLPHSVTSTDVEK